MWILETSARGSQIPEAFMLFLNTCTLSKLNLVFLHGVAMGQTFSTSWRLALPFSCTGSCAQL